LRTQHKNSKHIIFPRAFFEQRVGCMAQTLAGFLSVSASAVFAIVI